MEKIRIQRNVKHIEVNDNGEFITLDFDDLNLPYRYYGMLRNLRKTVPNSQMILLRNLRASLRISARRSL